VQKKISKDIQTNNLAGDKVGSSRELNPFTT
jgi:hypothetical protein